MSPVAEVNHRTAVLDFDKQDLVIINTYLPPRGKYCNNDFQQEVDQLHEICSKYAVADFYRVEMQHKGSCHVHMVVWIDGPQHLKAIM